jgi:hypothetical protein
MRQRWRAVRSLIAAQGLALGACTANGLDSGASVAAVTLVTAAILAFIHA